MKNEIINFFTHYQKRHPEQENQQSPPATEELTMAIQALIERLRDCNPLKHQG